MMRKQQVPQKITAYVVAFVEASQPSLKLRQARVKTQGKSLRLAVVTQQGGKPYGLQDQISRRLRAARPMPVGRLLELHSDVQSR